MMLHGTLSVFRFELRRTVTISRTAVWLLLTSFPIFIVAVVKYNEEKFPYNELRGPQRGFQPVIFYGDDGARNEVQIFPNKQRLRFTRRTEQSVQTIEMDTDRLPDGMDVRDIYDDPVQAFARLREKATVQEGAAVASPERKVPDTAWGLILFGLIPEVITLFGLLLWATPVVQSELEGRTWIYQAVRPRGRVNLLLGKYLTAITWTALAGWVSASICVLIARPEEALRLWATMLALVALACLAYGALYSLIGVLLHRRAMVIAVAYTLIFEFLVSLIPAVINKFTVQYRLRNLLVSFMQWREFLMEEASGAGSVLLGKEPPWLHVLMLIGISIALLVISAQVIQRKEYATADEA